MLMSQTRELIEYLNKNLTVYDALDSQGKAMRTPGDWFAYLRFKANLPWWSVPDHIYSNECSRLWNRLDGEWFSVEAPRATYTFDKLANVARLSLAKVRSEHVSSETEYKELIAFSDRYTGVEAFERAFTTYYRTFEDDDIAGMLRSDQLF